MNKHLYFIIALLPFLISCIDRHAKYDARMIASINRSEAEHYKIDTIVIPLDSVSKPYYFAKIAILETDSDLFYLAYNSQINAIDWFDLKSKVIKHTQIERVGPNGIPEITSIYPISKDSIFIFSYKALYLINSKGYILRKIDSSIKNKDGRKGFLMSNASVGAYFDKSKNEMYCGVNYIDFKNNETQPQAVRYNITDSTFHFLPVYYTEKYNQYYNQLGYTNIFSLQFYDNQLIYNFNYSPVFYIYDYRTKEVTIVNSKNSKADKMFEMLGQKASDEEKMAYYVSNPLFNLPLKCTNNQCYYRLSWTGAAFSSGIESKKIVLSRYSYDLSSFSEIFLNNKTYFIGSERVAKKGVIVIAQNKFTPNIDYEKIIFHIIR